MKVIDADKLIKDIKQLWDYKTVDDITATTVLKQTITDIENQPTVKAIPIEFIEAFKKEFRAVASVKAVIEWLLEKWEKENETN